jgi:hypothetical protein
MKLQVQGQHLRLRIGESELSALRDGATLENATCLGAIAWRLSLRLTDAEHASLRSGAGECAIEIPGRLVAAYAARLPCREGLALTLPAEGGPAIDVVLEVDVRDSVRNRGAARRS